MFSNLPEKRTSVVSNPASWSKTLGCTAIIFGQHLLLWAALYVAASTLYILCVDAVFIEDVPSVVLLLIASFVSLSYIILQNITTHLRRNVRNRMQSETVDTCQSLATHTLRILCTIWMVTVALNLTFTAARRPVCAASTETQMTAIRALDKGATCMVNRIGVIASCVALIACGMLFILVHKVNEPFRCHLIGFLDEDTLLPLFLPYRKPTHPMVSDMSFKCRSSTSLASNTLPTLWSGSTANLNPSSSSRPQGLGIFGAKDSTPSLLRPHPSMSSNRAHTTMSLPLPPTSPLPPLPAYFSHQYRATTGAHKPDHRNRPIRPPRSDDSIRMILPSPALSRQNIASLNRNNLSQSSLSSVYSRSISGETKPPSLSETGRTASSSSTVTLRKSRLEAMTLTEEVDGAIALGRLRESFDSDIDDVAALKARLAHATGQMKSSAEDGYVERHSGLSKTFQS